MWEVTDASQVLVNYHPDDAEPEHPLTPLARAVKEHPNRAIFVATNLGERCIEVAWHAVIPFLKHDPLVCGVVEYSSFHGEDILMLHPFHDYEHLFEDDA